MTLNEVLKNTNYDVSLFSYVNEMRFCNKIRFSPLRKATSLLHSSL